MSSFEQSRSSVTLYAHGVAQFDVFFPDGLADCRHCEFCKYVEPFNVYRCRLTSDFIEKTELNMRHPNCPITLDETQF